jgi:pilus assembly protein CpaF
MTEPGTTTHNGPLWSAPRINGYHHAPSDPSQDDADAQVRSYEGQPSEVLPDGFRAFDPPSETYRPGPIALPGRDRLEPPRLEPPRLDALSLDALSLDPPSSGNHAGSPPAYSIGQLYGQPPVQGPPPHTDPAPDGEASRQPTDGWRVIEQLPSSPPVAGPLLTNGHPTNEHPTNGHVVNGHVVNGPVIDGNPHVGAPVSGIAPPAGGAGTPYPMDRLEPQVHGGWGAPRSDTSAEPAMQVDYELVTQLQAEVSRALIDGLRGELSPTNAERRAMTQEYAERVVRRNVDDRLRSGETGPVTWPGYAQALCTAVTAYLIGLGRLQPLIDNPEIENIMVLGTRVRVVYANGFIDEDSFTAAASDDELITLLQRLAERGGQTERSLSTAKPILHLRLPDGARLTVIYVVTARPVVVIRRHRVKDVSLADMVGMGAITPTLKSFLEAAVRAHMNIMIAGRANAGKTTLLRAIADEIPREEWFCVLETVGELGLDSTGRHPWAICFEEREGFGDKGADGRPDGQLTIDDLFPHMLRLSANRIIVGEVRAEEIVAMFDAMNTTYGSLCTIHSRDEHGVFDRLAELLLRYGASKNREGAYLTIGNALDLVVYVNMEEYPGHRPRRYVSSVMEVHGLGEGRQLSRSRIFSPGPYGLAVPTSVRMSERRAAELQAAGFDMRLLLTPQVATFVPGGVR